MTVKATVAAVIAVFMLFLCGCQNAPQTPEPPEVKYDFTFSVLKVGQADAIILKTENHCVMIDCGEKDDGDVTVVSDGQTLRIHQ